MNKAKISENFKKQNKALTLIELQIASFIALITVGAVLTLYIFYWRTFAVGNNILDVYSSSRIAMEWAARDIRLAAQVVSSYGSYTTSDSSIVLQVPSIDASGNVISSHYDYIIYELQGGDLYRVVQKDALSSRLNESRSIAHYCTSLTFSSGGVTLSNISNLSTINTVAIYLPLNKTTISLSGAGTETASMIPTTVVRLRNK